MPRPTDSSKAGVINPVLSGFDVTIVAILITALLLLQPQLVLADTLSQKKFSTSNTALMSAVGNGPAYIDFWASWCGPCKDSLPWLSSLKKKGINVITVNLDSERKNADNLLAELAIKGLPVIHDPEGKIAAELELSSMPESLLVGVGRAVIKSHAGFHLDEQDQREQEIVAAFGSHQN